MAHALAGLSEFCSIVAAVEMEVLVSTPTNCEVQSVIKIFEFTEHSAERNSSPSVPAVISLSMPNKIVTEHPLFWKLCARWVPKQMTPEHKAKRVESELTIVVHLFLNLKTFLSGQRQRFQNDRVSHSDFNFRQQTSTTHGYISWYTIWQINQLWMWIYWKIAQHLLYLFQ